jgi:phospholipid transport system substrate-binding protein
MKMKHLNKIKLVKPFLLSLGIVASLFSVNILAYDEASQSTSAARIYVDKKDPYLMIKTVASKTFKRFADEQQAIQANPNILKNIVRVELMPYINY